MTEEYVYPDDSLRQDCLNILQNYRPERVRWPVSVSAPSMYSNTFRAKQEFSEKNQVYVHALRGVIKRGKDASIRQNIQATENLCVFYAYFY
jgi:hypothetical protein